MSKDQWEIDVERVMYRFDSEKISLQEAVKELVALGFTEKEAETEILQAAA